MMMLFHNGHVPEDAKGLGIEKIRFNTNGMDILDAFSKSLWYINGILGIYDVELYRRVNDKEVFIFYHTMAGKQNEHIVANKQSIIVELNAIMVGYVDNIRNHEDTMIKEAVEGTDLAALTGNNDYEFHIEETIFWDTLNNFVVIIGREQLEKFAYALEEERHRNLLSAFNEPVNIADFVNEDTMTTSTKKMLQLAREIQE